jgi:hypothetical protein
MSERRWAPNSATTRIEAQDCAVPTDANRLRYRGFSRSTTSACDSKVSVIGHSHWLQIWMNPTPICQIHTLHPPGNTSPLAAKPIATWPRDRSGANASKKPFLCQARNPPNRST